MTALLSPDGTNFTLACNTCGHLVAHLADTMHRWDLAWALLRRHGWTGEALATGPHTCPRCAQAAETAGTAEPAPVPSRLAERPSDSARPAPERRRPRRITATEQAVATVVEVRGELSPAARAALHELLLPDRPARQHIVVDLTGASTLDSGVLDVLVRAKARAARGGYELCLVGLSRSMHDALELLCLVRLLPAFADQAGALAWLRGEAPDRPTCVPRRRSRNAPWRSGRM